ncbi:MAG: type IV pilus modification protein PilV [Proteobacteria bacterium]|nr:type IV pilus modification protein PilV [Pseudomonadota bacterium]
MEVLVSVFVLSIGVLGVAGLQVTAKRSNFEATQRATAAALVQDIVERMRSNSEQLGIYTDAGAGRTIDGASMSLTDCSTDCGPDILAQYDLYELEQAANGVAEQVAGNNVGGLTLPTTCITGPDGGSGIYSVAIAWRGMTKLSDPATDACGSGSGKYDTVGATETDVYRRILVMQIYISETS